MKRPKSGRPSGLRKQDPHRSGKVTRVLTFSLLEGSREMIIERTGYRDNMPSPAIPRILHHGRMEDDLVCAKDKAFYIRTGPQ